MHFPSSYFSGSDLCVVVRIVACATIACRLLAASFDSTQKLQKDAYVFPTAEARCVARILQCCSVPLADAACCWSVVQFLQVHATVLVVSRACAGRSNRQKEFHLHADWRQRCVTHGSVLHELVCDFVSVRRVQTHTRHALNHLRLFSPIGTSSLYNLQRLEKEHAFFQALGDTDELNANIGLARQHCTADLSSLDDQLQEIQSRLLDLGSVRAGVCVQE